MMVPFTQYLRPNGQPVPQEIEVDRNLDSKVQAILSRGLTFECEVLTTGEISMTITSKEQDEAITICQNGPEVRPALEKMIREFRL